MQLPSALMDRGIHLIHRVPCCTNWPNDSIRRVQRPPSGPSFVREPPVNIIRVMTLHKIMERPLVREGRKVSLGIHKRDEIPAMYSEFADSSVQQFLGRPDRLYYVEGEYDWYDKISRDETSRVMAILLNRKAGGGKDEGSFLLIGSVGIHGIDSISRYAELGYLLFRKYWGKGYATEAVSLAVDYAFETLNLRKLFARVMEPNRASASVLEKNGFKPAGRLTGHVYLKSFGYANELYYELHRGKHAL